MSGFKNSCIFLLIKLSKLFGMKSFKRLDHNAPRILIISTTGLGDTLWATPAIKAIKTTYPKAFIGVLTSHIGYSVLSNNPYIDRLITIKHRCLFQLPSRLKMLRKERFDTALVFHLSQRATLPLCYFARPSQIIGTEGINKGLDSILTTKLQKKYHHEIERRLEIASHIGAVNPTPHIEIYPSSNDHLRAKHLLASFSNSAPIIALHPGSKDRFKQWPPSFFAALGTLLQSKLQAQILITGTQEESSLAQQISDVLPHSCNCAGLLSVKELAALLGSIDLFITNDTGPMHLAFAMNTKTIALFSPTDPKLCGPFLNAHTHVLYQQKTCTPCLGKKCRDAFCMWQHSPQDVFQHALTLLQQVPC